MRRPLELITSASAVAAILAALVGPGQVVAADQPTLTEQGKQIAFDRTKGNCLACHQIEGGQLPGNIGPPLFDMKKRYPDKAKLRDQIWDATRKNPNTVMPPFGRFGILTDKEIDKVVEFVDSL